MSLFSLSLSVEKSCTSQGQERHSFTGLTAFTVSMTTDGWMCGWKIDTRSPRALGVVVVDGGRNGWMDGVNNFLPVDQRLDVVLHVQLDWWGGWR